MANKRILIVYYSRTGITKKVATEMSGLLGADIEEIIDLKNRSGMIVYLTGGRDAMRGYLTDIEPIKRSPAEFDMVILGSPVWGGTIAPALRTYIENNKDKIKSAAFFCTLGGKNPANTFNAMQTVSGKEPVATLWLSARDVKKDNHKEELKRFVREIE